MNILKTLFGSNGKTDNRSENLQPIITDPIHHSTEDWLKNNFVDQQPPVTESQPESKSCSKVSEFLNRNYESVE